MWGWGWIDHLGRDLRDSARAVRKNPGFAVIVVTTVALGAGANTAIFSIVNGAVLKPLPFSEPNRLYILYERPPPPNGVRFPSRIFSTGSAAHTPSRPWLRSEWTIWS